MRPAEEFADPAVVARTLATKGISDAEVEVKARSFARAAAVLRDMGGESRAYLGGIFVPGRIEILGKHTDYAGGRSLLCAVEKGFTVLYAPRPDNLIRLRSLDGSSADFPLDPHLQPEMGVWTGYPQTVARRVATNFPSARTGVDVAFYSDLPRAAGMSSSSAMVVACFMVLSDVNNLPSTPEYARNIRTGEDLAEYLGTTENGQTYREFAGDRGVGTFGGSEDHTAILLSKPHKLVQYAYCPVRKEAEISLPSDLVFAITSSGVIAEKNRGAMAQYNRASSLARAVLQTWNQSAGRSDPTLAAAIDHAGQTPIRQALARSDHAEFTSKELLDRFDQFYAESEEILPAFASALARNDLETVGHLVDRSQVLTDTHLHNQVPETIYLARTARDLGAVAASAFGAGFGGSVWALIPRTRATEFLIDWKRLYGQRFAECARRAAFFTTEAGPAAFRLE